MWIMTKKASVKPLFSSKMKKEKKRKKDYPIQF